MKKIFGLSGVLTWVNMIAGSLLVLLGLLAVLASPGIFPGLLLVVLTGSIVLHSAAAFQLRKSITHENVPLSTQAPTGLRLMGFIALFFAIMLISSSVLSLPKAPELAAETLKQMQLPKGPNPINFVFLIRFVCVFLILIGISIAVNVALNLQMLRWYIIRSREEKES